jgi:hypothetical protein
MLTLKQRIQGVEDGLTLEGDYTDELDALNVIEQDIPVYRHLGTPVWAAQQAKEEIARIRTWIRDELAARN